MKIKPLLAIFALFFIFALSACSNNSFFHSRLPEPENSIHKQEQPTLLTTPGQPGANISGTGEKAQTSKEEEAYLKADRNPPRIRELKSKCVTVNGHEVCGYDCKVAGSNVKCATQPKARCVVGSNDEIACGFDCKTSPNHVACGRHLYSNCVVSATGQIKCGNNCQLREDGAVVCGK